MSAPSLTASRTAAFRCAMTAGASLLSIMLAMPAQADVLEIGPRGEANWIAGPLVAPPTDALVGDVPAEVSAVPPSAVVLSAHYQQVVPAAYLAKVGDLAARYDLSPALIEALVWQESRWRVDAQSPVGARGLAQLMPATALELGVDANDPMANLEGGARYLRAQLDRFDGDVERALAAYNAGPGRVLRAGGVPAIRETQAYVASIMGRLSTYPGSPE